MRIALLLILNSLALWGAELILPGPPYLYTDGADVQLRHGDAAACVNTPAGVSTNIGFAFDTEAHWQSAHVLRYRTGISSGSQSGTLCMPIKGLASSTLYRACPVMADASGNSTNCTSTGTDPNRFLMFTTLAAPTPDPAPPIRPDVSDFDTSYPANVPAIGAAGDFSVASDCHDLSSQIAAAVSASNSSGQPKAVTLPAASVCSGANLPTLPARAAGQPWVIIRTSAEQTLPSPGGRVSLAVYGTYMPVIKVVAANTSFINGDGTTNAKIRFVGIRIIFDDGTAFPGSTTATYTAAFLWRTTIPVSWIIFDRCIFDGQGYPSKIQAAVYVKGATDFQYVAFLGCHFANIYNWEAWMGLMTVTGQGTHTLTSSTSFMVGRGDQVCTVPPFAITTTDASTISGLDYIDKNCNHVFKYSVGTAPVCAGLTCVSDPGLSVPTTALKLNAAPMASTAGNWTFVSPTVGFWWGNNGFGNGIMNQGETDSFAFLTDAVFGYHPTIQKVIIQNSNFDGAGILILFSSLGVTSNVVVNRNDFSATPGCFMPNPPDTSHPFTCDTRYPFEIKNGHFVDVTGNTIHDWYGGRNADGSWFSLKPDTTIDPGAYSGDVYIADNYATQLVGCFYITGEISGNGNGLWNAPKTLRRVAYSDNFCQEDAWRYTSFFGKNGLGSSNYGFSVIDQGAVDITISHNTWYDTRGPGPGLLAAEAFSHGVSITGNLFTYHQSNGPFKGFESGYYGTGRWSASTIPDMGFAGRIEGTAGLNVAIPSLGNVQGISWTWDNLFVPGCVDSSPANCTSLTQGAGLVTAPTSLYPASTQWATGSTLAARFRNAGLTDPANGNFRQLGSSVYNSGGAHHALDGLAYGFDQDANERARGLILTPRALAITATTVSVAVTVPDPGAACSVAYSTSGGPPWTVTAVDTTNSRQRSLPVNGLSPFTSYSYQVWCAGVAPTLTHSFQTSNR